MARPVDGGTAIDLGVSGYAVVAEPVAEVHHKIQHALDDAQLNPEKIWVEFTVLADPNEEIDRRPCWMKADEILCLTYLSPEHIEKIETEID